MADKPGLLSYLAAPVTQFRQNVGDVIDYIGTARNMPEMGWSEKLAGNTTQFTGSTPDTRTFEQRVQQNAGTAPINITPVGSSMIFNPNGTSSRTKQLNTTNPGGGGGNPGSGNPAPDPYNPELASLNTSYDYNAAQARNQLSSLGDQYGQSVNELNTGFNDWQNQLNDTRTKNLSQIDQQIQAAGSTAQQTQMKNRNILRALGILNSSYAGESLQRPMEQFAQQRNDLMNAAQQRTQELDNMLTQRTAEHQNQLSALRNNYNNLVNQINTDLRFNDRQRADAVRAANAAMSNNLFNLKSQQQSIAKQVADQKATLEQAQRAILGYSSPTANLSNINATQETPGVVQNQSQQAGIYNADYLKKLYGQ